MNTDSLSFSELKLHRESFNVVQRRSIANLKRTQSVVNDRFGDELEDRLTAHIYGHPLVDKTIQYPETWFDGFKIAHFPSWLLKRYPASIKRIEIKATELATKLAVPENYGPVSYMIVRESNRRFEP